MPYNPAIHNRHSIRLPGYNYSQAGAYFLTILTHKKEHLFGEVVEGVMNLSPVGAIVQEEWLKIPTNFSNILQDAFVIMPNHMHGILVITEGEVCEGKGKGKAFEKRGNQKVHSTSSYSIHYKKSANMDSNALPIRLGSQPGSLPAIVQNFKSVSSRRINKLLGTPGSTIWHRNYYEHIIRNEVDFERIVAYIELNPQKWESKGTVE
jgi:REP element-mobilizing transposase RayT